MDKSVPPQAAPILDLIRVTETGRADRTAYETVYGHSEKKLTKPITLMTVDELYKHQVSFTKSFGSSASGGYQIMRATLADLKKSLALAGDEVFAPDLQDRLGMALLNRRGFKPWAAGNSSTDTMMIGLAKEWASFPVPYRMKGAHRMVERGQTFYSGDAVNKALIGPDKVWLALEAARDATAIIERPDEPVPKPEEPPGEVTADVSLDELMAALAHPDVKAAIAAVLAAEEDDGA